MDEKVLKYLHELAKVLASETRIRILCLLLKEGKNYCISDISKILDKDVSVISRHIRELEKVNLIEVKRVGKNTILCLKNPEKIKKLLEIIEQIYTSHLDQPQTKQI